MFYSYTHTRTRSNTGGIFKCDLLLNFQVGRALGASILDLSNSNPVSRLGNSEFRTLQGLRNALRLEIERSLTKSQLLPKVRKWTSFSRGLV